MPIMCAYMYAISMCYVYKYMHMCVYIYTFLESDCLSSNPDSHLLAVWPWEDNFSMSDFLICEIVIITVPNS